jgi:hypothetical protein
MSRFGKVSSLRWCYFLADNYPLFCSFFHISATKEQTDKNYQPKKTDKRLTLFAGSLSQAYLQSAAINFVRANPGQRSS